MFPVYLVLHLYKTCFSFSFQLLSIFVSGRLSDYVEFYEKNKDFVDSCGKIFFYLTVHYPQELSQFYI